jgi:outer membrane protein TolC
MPGNLDLKNARARRCMANADLFPTLDATVPSSLSRCNADKGTVKTSDLYSPIDDLYS